MGVKPQHFEYVYFNVKHESTFYINVHFIFTFKETELILISSIIHVSKEDLYGIPAIRSPHEQLHPDG